MLAIETPDGPLDQVSAGASVVLRLTTDLDVGRGDWLVGDGDAMPPRGFGGVPQRPRVTRDISADIAWVHRDRAKLLPQGDTPRTRGAPYVLKIATREVRAQIEDIEARYDVASGAEVPAEDGGLGLNDLARVRVRTTEPVPVDAYADLRATGSFLLIDAATGDTVAAGMAR